MVVRSVHLARKSVFQPHPTRSHQCCPNYSDRETTPRIPRSPSRAISLHGEQGPLGEKRKGPVATSRLGPCPTGAIMLSTRARGPRAVSCVRSACGHREVPSVPVEIDACHGTPFGTTASDATVPNLSRRPCSSPHGLPNAGAPNSLVSVGLGGKAVPHGSHELRHGVVQGKDHGVGARVKRVRHLEPAWSA